MPVKQNKGLKIVIFNDQFLPHTQTFVYNDVLKLAEQNEVLVVCLRRTAEEKFPFDNLQQIAYPTGRWRKKIWWKLYQYNLSMNYYSRGFSKEFTRVIRAFDPDVIHCHFGVNGLLLLDNLLVKPIPPIVVNLHGYDVSELLKQSGIYRKRLARLFMNPRVFPIATSQALLDNLERYKINGREKGRVIYSGIDVDFFDPSIVERNSSGFTFIQVAGFREKKGHRYTIQAFHECLKSVEASHSRLVFIGSGELEPEMKKMCSRLGISNNVVFAGWRSTEEVRQFLANADVLLHHSVTADNGDMESSPIAISEAMAMELPVVVSHHGGIPEIVEHGINGFLVPERDVEEYGKRMLEIMSWNRLPENRRKILAHHTYERRIEELLELYRSSIETAATLR